MDVKQGHCWRCEKLLPEQPLKCSGCPLAEYCSRRCQQQDRVRHGSVECQVFGPKRCSQCDKLGQMKECSGCHGAWYCNSDCQKRNRKSHKECCEQVTAYIQDRAMGFKAFNTEKGEEVYRTEEPPVYVGNTIANDFLCLKQNEWTESADIGEEEHHRDYYVLSAGCGDLRNTVLTVASLPAEYQGKLHITLDDLDPFVMARNVMFLFMMVRWADRDGIASSLATIWYSVHISRAAYDLIRATLQELLQLNADSVCDSTRGLVRISQADWGYLREVWERWLSLQCQRTAGDSINLHRQRESLFHSDFEVVVGLPNYLSRIPRGDAKFLKVWYDYGLFLPKDMPQSRLPYDNPTLTGRPSLPKVPNEIQHKLGMKTPKEYSFEYCVRTDQTPFRVWDCLRVAEFAGQTRTSVMVRYHAYVTDLLQHVVQFIHQGRLAVHVFLANCLDYPNHHLTLAMPRYMYDRIFTSNLLDYLGLCKLLKTFKPLLNSDNRHSAIVTQTKNWIIGPTRQADVEYLSPEEVEKYCIMCQEDTGFDKSLSRNVNNHREYFNNTHWFLAYLRVQIMGGGVGIPVMDHVPKFSEVMQYEGLRMRDFRKELNRLVPFQYRVNARRITMLNGHDRNVEWCLPGPDS